MKRRNMDTKRMLIAAAFMLAVAVLITAVCAGCTHGKTSASAPDERNTVSAVCPVMGTRIADVTKASGKSVYKGKTYYFCCPGCKPEFDKNPEKYVGDKKE